MKSSRTRARCAGAALLTASLLLATGCGQENVAPSTPAEPAQPAPVASFNLIVDTLKRRIQDVPSGFIMSRGGGHSRLSVSNKVTSELLPPAKEGDPYRATVTIVSTSSYTIRRPTGDDGRTQSEAENQDGNRSGARSIDDPGIAGIEVYDPELLSSPNTGAAGQQGQPESDDVVVRRRDDTEEKQFELEYRNGRWELLTKPNPETERAIQSAFDDALAMQR